MPIEIVSIAFSGFIFSLKNINEKIFFKINLFFLRHINIKVFILIIWILIFNFMNKEMVFAMEKTDSDMIAAVDLESLSQRLNNRLDEIRSGGPANMEAYIALLSRVAENIVDNVHPTDLGSESPIHSGWSSFILWAGLSFLLYMITRHWEQIRDAFFEIGRVADIGTMATEAARFNHLSNLAHNLVTDPQTREITLEILQRNFAA